MAHLVQRREQGALQFQDAAPHAQACLQFHRVEGLGQVVVGACPHALDEVLAPVHAGQQDDVGIGSLIAGTDPGAELDAVHVRHQPVENEEVGTVRLLQDLPGPLSP